MKKGLKKLEISVGNLNSLRTHADVRDAVKAYYLAIMGISIPGNVYNIMKLFCKVKDMLKNLISLSDFRGKIKIKIEKNRLRPIDDLQIPDKKI